jgi:hypothetical protein
MLLQRHQVLQGIHPRRKTGGHQAGEHTGKVGTVLGGKEQRVFALPDKEFSGPLDEVIFQGGTGYG